MDFKQLEYFVRVAEFGSLTRASIVLDIAQPALSRQIRLLELELGQTLLHRNGRGVVCNDAGKLLLEYGRGILYQVERLREEMGRVRGALNGKVSLGLPPSLLKTLTVPLYQQFRAQLPAAALSIREGLSVSMSERIITGQLDVALLYNATPSPEIELTSLCDSELLLVAPLAAAASLPAQISLHDLPNFPLIAPSRPNAFRMLIEAQLAQLGLRPTIAIEVDGVSAILDLVNEGIGYAILSQQALSPLSLLPSANTAAPRRTLASGLNDTLEDSINNNVGTSRICARPFAAPGLSISLTLAISAHRQITATQQALMTLVQKIVQRKLNLD